MELNIITSKIYEIRGQKVMLDFDLAELYGIETRALNQAVNRNIERFPEDFMFRINDSEYKNLKSQIVIRKAIVDLKDVSEQLEFLKNRIANHDAQLNEIYTAIENLLDEKVNQKDWQGRERIGFKS